MPKKGAMTGNSATVDPVKINQIVRCIECSYVNVDFKLIKELLGIADLTVNIPGYIHILEQPSETLHVLRVIATITGIDLNLSNNGCSKTGWFGRVPCTEDQYRHRRVSLNEVYKKLAPTRPRNEQEFFRNFLTMLFVQKDIAEHKEHLCDFLTDFVELTLRANNLAIPEDFREKKAQEIKTFILEFHKIAEDEDKRKVKQDETHLVEKVNPTCYD
ncbi:unnamed protein product [Cylicocyclus nassatus]|uniref:Uncharacterized protein n=1 Tax=Cylicocyclus nassatus TaxID=53992 RepID=A0AA36DNJ7_CYLNA|nr:unnamed protein product [Cylicocyclus nassatus]